jgi:SAM-dependent methyltransferase
MTLFKEYAKYYDLLYKDKNYDADCDFLERVFERYTSEKPRCLLEFGCGTGGHSLNLVRRGYHVTGVDCSADMLQFARQKVAALPELASRITLEQADFRSLDLHRKFDAVISLFAVLSYMTTNQDLQSAFQSARLHLDPHGLLVFDVWYGPAVITERPQERHLIVTNGQGRVIRLVRPTLDLYKHTVQVNYTVLRLIDSKVVEEVSEVHTMRFLFPQEIINYLENAGFMVKKLSPVLNLDGELTDHDWSMSVIAEAK